MKNLLNKDVQKVLIGDKMWMNEDENLLIKVYNLIMDGTN